MLLINTIYRTEKTVNGVTTKYYLDGDKVVLENNGNCSIYYTYDADDKLVSMTLNGTEYFYICNGQGDIAGLIDTSGTQVVSYTYDSWGKLVSIDGSLKDTVGLQNPYRYRGYRYDTETGLYYLQSRYYNPDMGRYINADDVEFLGASGTSLSYNLFAYCENNPVNNSDPSGYISWYAVLASGIAGGLWCLGKYIAWNYHKFSGKRALIEFIGGFITGGLSLAAIIQLPHAIRIGLVGAVLEVSFYLGQCVGNKSSPKFGAVMQRALVGFSMGLTSYGAAYLLGKINIKIATVKSGQISVTAVIYSFLKGMNDGYLTKFFSLK